MAEPVSRSIRETLAAWEAERGLRSQDRKAVYVSAPITTGLLFTKWFESVGRALRHDAEAYSRAHRAEVILPNVQRMARYLELLRWRNVGIVIDPTALEVPGWEQSTYHTFWEQVIRRHVRRVIFLDGWHFSNGCSLEFEAAQTFDIDCVDERMQPLSRRAGIGLLKRGADQIQELGLDNTNLSGVADRLFHLDTRVATNERTIFKDHVLDHIASTSNVAQFASFSPGEELGQRFCRIRGLEPNQRFGSVEEAVRVLLERAPEGMVNIRSFDPERPEGNPFIRRLKSLDEVLIKVSELGREKGLYTIVNETIDESDGGVSGVSYRNVLEFAPDSNPRCVDDVTVGTAQLPFELGMRLLNSVYGFEPDLRGREGARVEFSIHPQPRGWLNEHTIIWQVEQRPASGLTPVPSWPNRFSRFLGDKAFGLALASAAGLPVPRTTVFGRRLFPFGFGEPVGSRDLWTRTCPEVKAPGFFGSAARWHDPYAVLEDPTVLDPYPKGPPPVPLASVIIQEGIPAAYSGRTAWRNDVFEIHGVPGNGMLFMLGDAPAAPLPDAVKRAVRDAIHQAVPTLGRIDTEWVYDGTMVWIAQLSPPSFSSDKSLEADTLDWVEFRVRKNSIEEFRELVESVRGSGRGIVVFGNVSPLSHYGEIADLHGVPCRFVRP